MAFCKLQFDSHKVTGKVRRATYKTLWGTASLIARGAKASIKKTKIGNYAKPGKAPHTRGGRHSLKEAIRYFVNENKGYAVIGPDANVVGVTGYFHEFGGRQIKGRRRKYKVGGGGPIDVRAGGIIFTKLKTERQARRATRLDLMLWPTVIKERVYPQRPFMRPALEKKRGKILPIFRASM